MNEGEDRLVTPEIRGDEIDSGTRPQTLDDFTGQAQARENLKVSSVLQKRGVKRWTMCCLLGLRAWQDDACSDHGA